MQTIHVCVEIFDVLPFQVCPVWWSWSRWLWLLVPFFFHYLVESRHRIEASLFPFHHDSLALFLPSGTSAADVPSYSSSSSSLAPRTGSASGILVSRLL